MGSTNCTDLSSKTGSGLLRRLAIRGLAGCRGLRGGLRVAASHDSNVPHQPAKGSGGELCLKVLQSRRSVAGPCPPYSSGTTACRNAARVYSLWSGICQHMQILPFHPCMLVTQRPTKKGCSLIIWARLARNAECHQLSSGCAPNVPQLRMPRGSNPSHERLNDCIQLAGQHASGHSSSSQRQGGLQNSVERHPST